MRKHLQFVGDNGLHLSRTSMVKSWSMMLGPMCMANYCCRIYRNPFAMSGLEQGCVAVDWLVPMSGSDGAQESCDCSLVMSLCVSIFLSSTTTSPCLSLVLARTTPSTVGPHIPLPCPMAKGLVKGAIVSPSYFIKHSKMANIVFFLFHFLIT